MSKLSDALRQTLQSHLPDELQAFVRHWPDSRSKEATAAASLPVTRWIGSLREGSEAQDAGLLDLLRAQHQELTWRQSYTVDDLGEDFIRNYGFVEIVGQRSALYSDRMAAGLLLFGPDQCYPAHRHQASEIYLPLAGTAEYLMADETWQSKQPGEVIHNRPMVWHGTHTRQEPVLIAWAWIDGDLTQKSEIAS